MSQGIQTLLARFGLMRGATFGTAPPIKTLGY